MPQSKAVIPIDVACSMEPELYEREHVHEVYNKIATHFSSTRYKPWPVVAQFLQSIPTGWVGLDSGTGNGKYLPLPVDRTGQTWIIGLDRSRKLLEIAQKAVSGDEVGITREVVWGDVLGNNWRAGAFDYAISIATIHHLSTPERRQQAIQSVLRCLSPKHGRALIYVWATEQDALSKRSIPLSNETLNRGQDVFVPWVSVQSKESQCGSPSDIVHNRYYHMFESGELRDLVTRAATEMGFTLAAQSSRVSPSSSMVKGIDIVQDGWERSNYFVEIRLWEQ